jgi:hypothetical protein
MKDKNEKQVIIRGRVREESKGEYGWCTFYTRMNIDYLNLLKSLLEGD